MRRPADDCSDRRLHCEDGAEAGLALRDALVRLGCFEQRVAVNY